MYVSSWYYRTAARNAIEKIAVCRDKQEAMRLLNKAKTALSEIGEELSNIKVSEEDVLKQITTIGE
jgi:hypothetical protein